MSSNLLDQAVNDEVLAMQLAYTSIVDFRRIYLPAPNERPPAWFHHKWDDILRNGKTHFAVEAFRESAKTQIVIRAHTLYRLMFPSEQYNFIVLIMANQTLASSRLKDISDEFLSHPKLSANLVEVKQKTEKVFHVVVKDLYGKPMEVRIEAHGKGSSIRGLAYGSGYRPNLIICDDLQDTADGMSETVTDKDHTWFLSDVMFLGQEARIFMIGNNLGESCLIERILKHPEYYGFETMRIPIVENGQTNWPDKYTMEFIDQERENFTLLGQMDVWYRERMCEALSPDSQLFKEEYFKYFDWGTLKLNDLNIFTTVDLAISQKKTADYTSVCTVGVNSSNNWFVLDIDYGRYDPTQQIEAIFKAVSKWHPQKLGIEKVAYQASLCHFLEKEMPARNLFFQITPLKAERKKEERIAALQPRFAAGAIWLPRNASFNKELKAQLLAFPKGIHDDLPDSLAYIEQIATNPIKRHHVIYQKRAAGSM